MKHDTHARAPSVQPAAECDRQDGDARFGDDLGRHIRHWRRRRGLSRRSLARASSVSERYLRQIETGNGNLSVMLLRRVASALGVVDLLAPEVTGGAAFAARRNRIALIGMRGYRRPGEET